MKKVFILFILFSLIKFGDSNLINAQTWDEIIKLCASDRDSEDIFGYSVAISGNYAIVGAYREDEDISGTNSLDGAGSVYIFQYTNGSWQQTQKLVASDRAPLDRFGVSVDINGDYAIVGACTEDEDATGTNTLTDAGSAYIFKNNSGTWEEIKKIVASDRAQYNDFGWSVTISNNYAIVGADCESVNENEYSMEGSAYIFQNNSDAWDEMQKIVPSDRTAYSMFGWSIDIDGNHAIIGEPFGHKNILGEDPIDGAGSSYIFQNINGTWNEVQIIFPSDPEEHSRFGYSVSISGVYAIVGAYRNDKDDSGINPLNNAGSAYIFQNNSGTWQQSQKIVPSDRDSLDYFGRSVAINEDFAIIGAPNENENTSGTNTLEAAGSAYIFQYSGTTNIISENMINIKVIPNPTSGLTNIIGVENGIVTVIDIMGKTVLSQKINTVNNTVNLKGYPHGIYILRVQSENNFVIIKVFVE